MIVYRVEHETLNMGPYAFGFSSKPQAIQLFAMIRKHSLKNPDPSNDPELKTLCRRQDQNDFYFAFVSIDDGSSKKGRSSKEWQWSVHSMISKLREFLKNSAQPYQTSSLGIQLRKWTGLPSKKSSTRLLYCSELRKINSRK